MGRDGVVVALVVLRVATTRVEIEPIGPWSDSLTFLCHEVHGSKPMRFIAVTALWTSP